MIPQASSQRPISVLMMLIQSMCQDFLSLEEMPSILFYSSPIVPFDYTATLLGVHGVRTQCTANNQQQMSLTILAHFQLNQALIVDQRCLHDD